jgi:hypothetical protein
MSRSVGADSHSSAWKCGNLKTRSGLLHRQAEGRAWARRAARAIACGSDGDLNQSTSAGRHQTGAVIRGAPAELDGLWWVAFRNRGVRLLPTTIESDSACHRMATSLGSCYWPSATTQLPTARDTASPGALTGGSPHR